jgi:glycopeptide antibiotics resistance protein
MKKQELERRIIKLMYTGIGVFYTACLMYIFFFARRRWNPFPERRVHLVPFRNKILYLQAYSIHTRQENLEFYKDLVGNILLFIPIPFLLYFILGIKTYRKLILIPAITSFFVETIQYIMKIGVADIDDLLLNTTGALLGVLLLHLATLRNNKQALSTEKWRMAR